MRYDDCTARGKHGLEAVKVLCNRWQARLCCSTRWLRIDRVE
jgi:hypothetical protein